MSAPERAVCVHGHFYQPPRESPWLEAIERQDGARPFHDWNERVAAECYEPNRAARILDARGRIVRIVSNYERLSFDVGPTLMAWLERRSPAAYAALLAADRAWRERRGDGAALALPYNHMILPLAAPRDRRTQVVWGIRDFERRFGRRPEGMWLPETAVDVDSLETLAESGIRFTVLAPHQAARVRRSGVRAWERAEPGRLEVGRAYRQRLPSGREIALFFYHGALSAAVAFERLLDDGERFARRLLDEAGAGEGPRLLHIASDGETYGHHHRYGEMALAYALDRLETEPGVELTTYAAWLAAHPPEDEVEIAPQTSWSCAHGIERWRSDCGCHTGQRPEWGQAWRAPLREALDWLRDELAPRFERAAGGVLRDPWAARDGYIDVILDRSDESLERFFGLHARGALSTGERTAALELLELQRHAQLMYTSCGWFFDDVGGIEAIQVLRYAARAVQLAEAAFGESLEPGLVERLARVPSNDPALGDAGRIWRQHVLPGRLDLRRVAVHHAAAALFHGFAPRLTGEAYAVELSERRGARGEAARLEAGRLRVVSRLTRAEESVWFLSLFHGRHGLAGGLAAGADGEAFRRAVDAAAGALERGDVPASLLHLDEGFPLEPFGLDSLLPDERRFLVTRLLEERIEEEAALHRRIYERDAPLMRNVAALGVPLPRGFRASAETVLDLELRRSLGGEAADPVRAAALLTEARDVGAELDAEGLGFVLRRTLEGLAESLEGRPEELETLDRLLAFLALRHAAPLRVDAWRVQNRLYELLRDRHPEAKREAAAGERGWSAWVERFERACERLGLAV